MEEKSKKPQLVSIVGKSGTGKTTLVERLVPELRKRGLRIGTVKHHLHAFEMDSPGKDSWRHKQAGAERSIISSPHRIGLVMDVDHDYSFDELIPFFSGMDIVLAEGYKGGNGPKVEIFRPEVHAETLCLEDPNLIAMVTDQEMEDLQVPIFGLDNIKDLTDFIIRAFKLQRSV